MMYKLAFFVLSMGFVLASPHTPVRKCKGVAGDLFESVVVTTESGVCEKLPCKFVRGKEATADITFLTRHEVSTLKIMCNATVMGVQVNYPLPDADDGCGKLTNTFCPVESNTEAELKLTMEILPIFPKVKADLVFYLLDQSNEMISCFEMTAQIVEGKKYQIEV